MGAQSDQHLLKSADAFETREGSSGELPLDAEGSEDWGTFTHVAFHSASRL